VSWLFLVAYTCSGLAGLVYEVTWTRFLTLYIGHTTAAASAVVAAFLGGLAAGAGASGRIASRLTPRRSLQVYAALEVVVAVAALLLPLELSLFGPVLRWAYQDGAGGAVFAGVRLASCLVMVLVPAVALGATFPMAIRWFARGSDQPARQTSALYFVNTAGAAAGALLAGFVLIPSLGINATIYVAMAGSALAAISVLAVLWLAPAEGTEIEQEDTEATTSGPPSTRLWLATAVLGVSGFAALTHEIAWTRILSLILGPTTYAFAATLAAVIAGVAIGSGVGTWLVSTRGSKAPGLLAFTLSLAAVTASWTYSVAGARLPMMVARQVADFADFDRLLLQGVLLTMALILPTSACLGAAFPLALALADDRGQPAASRFGLVYAINTLGAVAGSLAAGFWFIPAFGLQPTLWIVSGCLIASVAALMVSGALTGRSRAAALVAALIAVAMVVTSPPWDRELLASGVYIYAPYVPKDLDLETQLKAGELLYYEEGAAATVSVKKLTGTTTLAVDGKTDASNRGDMLTQKLIAHLPLLLHDNPKDVFIVGLGSGVTVGAALIHPIARADVIEISPEVVTASELFKVENQNALADPRTNLIVGDGRSHLVLSGRKYDVIVSEPSNPWIAGVSALFTTEFFASARDRLAPGGIICQWANAYNISEPDLKSIVATFTSVFPNGTVWLVGGDDVLLMASLEPIDGRLERLAASMNRPTVAVDLASVGVVDSFSILSLYIGGPEQLGGYAKGAPIFTDDRMTLEFSAPRELHNPRAGENGAALVKLLGHGGPEAIRQARAGAGASEWRHRAAMLEKADVHQRAYDDYVRALEIDPGDAAALDGLVRTAAITRRSAEALARLGQQQTVRLTAFAHASAVKQPDPTRASARFVATSKLQSAAGLRDEAIATARLAQSAAGLEQLASLFADSADTVRLDETVDELRRAAPDRAPTEYYAAVARFLHGHAEEAVALARRAIALDANYTPTYDLVGAAYVKLGQLDQARDAFKRSLSFDAHDSTAYENLGVLELEAGNRALAANYFAEALWLVPDSPTAREGLNRARRGSP